MKMLLSSAEKGFQFKYSRLFIHLYLLLLCIVCYGNSLDGEFVFDDHPAILENPVVQKQTLDLQDLIRNDYWGTPLNRSNSHKSFRPLITLMFYLEQRYKLTPFTMKLINLILHMININLVWCVLRDLFPYLGQVPLLTATLFAIHPVHTETVCGIVSRADLVAALLYLCGIWVSLKKQKWNYLLVIILTAIGLLAKEIVITMPLVCLILDFLRVLHYSEATYSMQKLLWRYCYCFKTIFYIISLFALSLLRCWQMDFSAPKFQPMDNPVAYAASWQTRFLSQQYLYLKNIQIILQPSMLCFDWSFGCIKLLENWQDFRLIALAILYCVLAMVMRNYRKNLPAVGGLVLCIVPFLPASGLLVRVGFVIAERLLYLPAIGFCYLIALGYLRLYSIIKYNCVRNFLKIFFSILVIVLCLRCRQRSLEWMTEKTLFTSALEVCPDNAKVHYNIGKLSGDAKNYSLALVHYHRAIALQPEYEPALMNLGNLYRNLGDIANAEKYLHKLVTINPNYATAWMNLGIVYANIDNDEKAFLCYQKALKIRPNYANSHYNLGNLYLKQNVPDKAIEHWQKAIEIRPKMYQAWINLLTMFDNRGMYLEVLNFSEKATKVIPFNSAISMVRANVYGKLHEYHNAEQLYLIILSQESGNYMCHTNLGILYHRWGKIEQAIEHYKKAIELQPIADKDKTIASKHLKKLLQEYQMKKVVT